MIYIIVFLLSALFAAFAERSKDKGVILLCSVISILIPSILAGIRAYGVGVDTRVYVRPHTLRALNAPNFMYHILNNSGEPGYKTLNFIIMQTLGHENWCYFSYQIITTSCVYIGIWKHRKFVSVSFAMFVALMIYYNHSLNVMRQYMAAAIVFMGLDQVEQRKYIYFSLYVVLAITFHYSAFIAFIIPLGMHFIISSRFINKYRYTKVIFVYIAVFVLISARRLMNILAHSITLLNKYIAYFDSQYAQIGASNTFILMMLGEILMLYFYRTGAIKTFSDKRKVEVMNFLGYNAVFLLIYHAVIQFYSFRVLIYSQLINVILLASLPSFVKEKNLKILVAISIIIIISYSWYKSVIVGNGSGTWPYRSIL